MEQANNHAKQIGLYKKALKVTPQELKKIKAEILALQPVKIKLEEWGDLVTDDMINRGLNDLYYYGRRMNGEIIQRHDRYYLPVVTIYNGSIHLAEQPRKEVLPYFEKAPWKRRLNLEDVSDDNLAMTWEQYQRDLPRMQAIAEAERIFNEYGNEQHVAGIWLVGRPGNGKSCLMALLAKSLNRKKLAGVTMVNVGAFLSELSSVGDWQVVQAKIKHLQKVDVLILDDIGAENLTDWNITQVLFQVLEYRLNKKLLTCFTSNLTKNDYFNRLKQASKQDVQNATRQADRLMTRIDGLAKEIQMGGENKRQQYH